MEKAGGAEEVVGGGGAAKGGRGWGSVDRIVEALKTMVGDQTLVVQSGKPIGVFTTHRLSPIAVIANGNVVAGLVKRLKTGQLGGFGLWVRRPELLAAGHSRADIDAEFVSYMATSSGEEVNDRTT